VYPEDLMAPGGPMMAPQKNSWICPLMDSRIEMADPHMVDPTEDPLDVDGVDPADIHLKAVVVSEEMAVILIIDPPSVIILEDPPSVIILEDPHSMKTSKDPPSGEDPVVDPLDPGNVEAVEVAADLTTEDPQCGGTRTDPPWAEALMADPHSVTGIKDGTKEDLLGNVEAEVAVEVVEVEGDVAGSMTALGTVILIGNLTVNLTVTGRSVLVPREPLIATNHLEIKIDLGIGRGIGPEIMTVTVEIEIAVIGIDLTVIVGIEIAVTAMIAVMIAVTAMIAVMIAVTEVTAIRVTKTKNLLAGLKEKERVDGVCGLLKLTQKYRSYLKRLLQPRLKIVRLYLPRKMTSLLYKVKTLSLKAKKLSSKSTMMLLRKFQRLFMNHQKMPSQMNSLMKCHLFKSKNM